MQGSEAQIRDYAGTKSVVVGFHVEPIMLDGLSRMKWRQWDIILRRCEEEEVVERTGVRFITLSGTVETVETPLAMRTAMRRANTRLEAIGIRTPFFVHSEIASRVTTLAVLTGAFNFDGSGQSCHFAWMDILQEEWEQHLETAPAGYNDVQTETPRQGMTLAFSQLGVDVTRKNQQSVMTTPVAAAAVVASSNSAAGDGAGASDTNGSVPNDGRDQ